MQKSLFSLLFFTLMSGQCAFAQTTTAVNPDAITLYVPSFFSEPATIGRNVATVLGLQVWETLRASSSQRRPSNDFGEGVVRWSSKPLSDFGHLAATADVQRADILAQMVLWGKAYQFGDGVVVSSELTIPRYDDFRTRHLELWTVNVPRGKDSVRIVADLPNRSYSFEPFVLSPSKIAEFSRPNAVAIFSAPRGGQRVGHLSATFNAHERSFNSVYVSSGETVGWVRLGNLSDQRTEIIDFVSALFRIFRGDWAGSRDFLDRVIKSEKTPTSIRVDAYLLRAYAGARLGSNPSSDLGAAERLSPTSARVVMYRVMNGFEQLVRSPASKRQSMATEILNLLAEKEALFSKDDSWYLQCKQLAEELVNQRPN